MEQKPVLAIIGGSGLYDFPALENVEQREIKTPFGSPSAPLTMGTLEGKSIVFLARHGIGHTLTPTEVNYRANIYALKSLGVDQIISISACGSLREDFAPGHIVVPSQLFDFTHLRKRSFFEEGLVSHVSVADPFCPILSTLLNHHRRSPVFHEDRVQYLSFMGYVSDRNDHMSRSFPRSRSRDLLRCHGTRD
jgi:5'-methylthioadenosine phosphorylase